MQTASAPADQRESQTFYLRDTATRRFVVALAKVLLMPFMNLEIEGQSNLPQEGACVVAANHVTNLDVFPLQFALSRPLFFMAKAELFANPMLGGLVRRLGAFPVERGSSDQWAMDHARRVLDEGLTLGMFPEGTRSRGRGLAVAKTGAARLAIEKKVPIVPVGIAGSDAFFRGFPRRNSVRVSVSSPTFPRPDDDPLSLIERVMFAMAASLPEAMRGVYPDRPEGFEA